MKPYILAAAALLLYTAGLAQQKNDKAIVSLQREKDRLAVQVDTARQHTAKEQELMNSFYVRLEQAQRMRKDIWVTLTSERRRLADSLDKTIFVQRRVVDSIHTRFDRSLVVLDSTLGLMNEVEQKINALKKKNK